MMRGQKRVAEVAVLMVVLLVLGAVVVALKHNEAASEQAKTSTGAAASALNATFVATIDPAINPEGLRLPVEAALQTPDQAIAQALEYAKNLGANNPHLVDIKLETLKTAMETSQRMEREDPERALMPFPGVDPQEPVWRVFFDGDTFTFPSCPPVRNDQGTPEPCPKTISAQFIIDPMDGTTFGLSLGLKPLP